MEMLMTQDGHTSLMEFSKVVAQHVHDHDAFLCIIQQAVRRFANAPLPEINGYLELAQPKLLEIFHTVNLKK